MRMEHASTCACVDEIHLIRAPHLFNAEPRMFLVPREYYESLLDCIEINYIVQIICGVRITFPDDLRSIIHASYLVPSELRHRPDSNRLRLSAFPL